MKQSAARRLWVSLVAILLTFVLVFTSFPGYLLAQTAAPPQPASGVFDNYPPLEPTNLAATQSSIFQVQLSWQNDPHHIIKGSRIERSTDRQFIEDVTQYAIGASEQSFTDSAVVLGATYFYRIFAFNDKGESPASSISAVFVSPTFIPISSQTVATEPVVTTGGAVQTEPHSFTLSGTLISAGSADLMLGYFEWGKDTNYGALTDRVVLSSTGSFSASTGYLIPGIYHYRAVAAGNGAGFSYGSDAIFQVLEAPPSTKTDPEPTPPQPFQPGPSLPWETKTHEVKPDTSTTIATKDERLSLVIPAGAVSSSINVEISKLTPTGSSATQILSVVDLKATDVKSGAKKAEFDKKLTIAIQHMEQELAGLDLDSLQLYYFNEVTRSWEWVPSHFDKNTLTLTAEISHFSQYGEVAHHLAAGPGRVMAAQVNLSSGTASFSYPIELPPGPGGFQPKLELTYSSGVADEMKDKRASGSWVGTGWSLHLGRISYDLSERKYYLDLNGSSYELISLDGVDYHTKPEQFLKITRTGNTWTLYDKSGVSYQFGGTSDSRQYLPNSIYYRWDLNLITDPNGNFATISYVQEIMTSPYQWVRSAYPEYIRYAANAAVVHFTLGSLTSGGLVNRGSDGLLRKDNPISVGYNPAPKIMETRQLDSIEITFNGTPIRKYAFAYNTIDVVPNGYSGEYNGIYYATQHTLTSITQVGANGTSPLPAMSFGYVQQQLYRHTSEGDYVGNPGNAAILTRPYLATINSGYGGSIAFAYQQTPITLNNWTRQKVVSKTVSGGMAGSVPEVFTYSYGPGANPLPAYLGLGWDQKFRGFSEVTEADALGNYTKHFFYTTGTEDSEKLTGMEYKTQWYEHGAPPELLREVNSQWSWHSTVDQTEGSLVNEITHQNLQAPHGIAFSDSGIVYVSSYTNSAVVKFSANGDYLGTMTHSNLYHPWGIDVSNDGYIFVMSDGYGILKFDANWNYIRNYTDFYGTDLFTGLAVADDGYIYWACTTTNSIWKLHPNGSVVGYLTSQYINCPQDVAISPDGSIYVSNWNNNLVVKFSPAGNYITNFTHSDINAAKGVTIPINDDNVYVTSVYNDLIVKFDKHGNYVDTYQGRSDQTGIDVGDHYIYTAVWGYNSIALFTTTCSNWAIRLDQIDTTVGNVSEGEKTSQIRFEYDDYGNIKTILDYGDTLNPNDNRTTWRVYHAGATHILDKPASERVYEGIDLVDIGGPFLKAETLYYYDNNASNGDPPVKGNLTRIEKSADANHLITVQYGYDSWGNKTGETDANNKLTTYEYDTTHHIYLTKKTYPRNGTVQLTEFYTYDIGTNNLMESIGVNGLPDDKTTYTYDTFKRLVSIDRPLGRNPDVIINYNDVLAPNPGQQHILIQSYFGTGANEFTWEKVFYDGLGREVQVQNNGEETYTIISKTVTYNNRGLVEREYVGQNLASSQINGYKTPDGWKYTAYEYDALGKITRQTSADSTWITHDFSTAWKDTVTNERLVRTEYYFDAFNRLIQVKNLGRPTVVTNPASSVSSNSATLNGNLASLGGASTVAVSFEWGLTTSYGNTTTPQNMAAIGAYSAAISGLSPNTTYHFRAKAVGTETAYGNDFTLTTPTVAPAVSSSAATGIAQTTAVLNSNLSSLGSAANVTLSFEWGLTTSYGNTTAGQQFSAPSNFYAAISGLSANTTYHFRAKAVGSSTVYGSDRQFTTQSSGGSPVDINKTIGSGANDGFSGSGVYSNNATWYEAGKPGSSTTYNAWFCFNDVTIPSGAVIDAAYLTTVQGSWISGTSLKITAEDAANPSAPTSQANHSGKTRTTAGVAWTTGYADWQWHNSPDFTSVIQELVDSYSYSSSAVQILVDNNGSATGAKATGATFENGYAPRLFIRYHLPGGGSAPPAVGTDTVTSLTATSATLNANLPNLGSASSVQVSFEWSLDLSYSNATTPQTMTSVGAFSANLSGLVSNTIYHFRAKAVGATTEYGSDMIFRTTQSVDTAITTTYQYDVLGNLTHVIDHDGNDTEITYDWLSRKLTMSDPDMGDWSYVYDNNGNLTSQTDAKGQMITLAYDALNRLTGKTGTGLNVTYTYDTVISGDKGNGHRTGMTDAVSDASHPSTYKYDARGRLVEEIRWEQSDGAWHSYTTTYTYDGLDRVLTIGYPNGETVTNTYNGRGLPNELKRTESGNTTYLVNSTLYNQLGQITQITFNNTRKATYSYYGLDGVPENGQYGKLKEIKNLPQSTGNTLLDLVYSWDAAGNMSTRQDVLASETESFSYDSLDRLTGVTGPYVATYVYDEIGNITSSNGVNYAYGSKPHAVTSVGDADYAYDDNGNMITRDSQTIEWDIENRPKSVSSGTGGANYGLSFDGNDTVSRTGSALKVGESQGTSASYEFWLKVNGAPSQSMIIMSKGSINPYVATNGTLCCDFFYANQTAYYAATSINVANGAWHYVACTHDGTTSKVYVDGVLRASATNAQPLANTYSDALVLGQAVWGGNFYTGFLDEVRVSSTARNQTEITASWAAGAGQSCTSDGSTAVLYHMNDQAGTLTDSSANSLNGTINGATYATGFGFPGGGAITLYIYDGDGKRIKKTENGETTLYINQYYEKNLTTQVVITSYYLGGMLVAEREGAVLRFIHKDSLGSASLVTSDNGTQLGYMKFYPYGSQRVSQGDVGTDRLFTGQRLDSSTGLYYYNARYYDPGIGRFISPDIYVQNISYPQTLNRYTYVLNNPVNYTDPTGWKTWGFTLNFNIGLGKGYSFSIGVFWDDKKNVALIGTKEEGQMYGDGIGGGIQFQYSTADTVYDLTGESTVYGGSVTIGPTTPETLGLVNAGWNGNFETVEGSNYVGFNTGVGFGASILPAEYHNFTAESAILLGQKPSGKSGLNSTPFSPPTPCPPTMSDIYNSFSSSGFQDPGLYSAAIAHSREYYSIPTWNDETDPDFLYH